MATYGTDKARDIARSALPADRDSARRARAQRATTHRYVRAATHRTLRRLTVEDRDRLNTYAVDETIDDYDECDPVAPLAQRAGPYGGIRNVVRRRRDGDTLGPLLRWAHHHAPAFGDDPASRIVAIRRVLPGGLVGEHAISHVTYLADYRTSLPGVRDWESRQRDRAEMIRAAHSRLLDDLRQKLHADIGVVQQELNTRLKAQICGTCENAAPVRLLLGTHDIDSFLIDVFEQRPCRIARRVVLDVVLPHR